MGTPVQYRPVRSNTYPAIAMSECRAARLQWPSARSCNGKPCSRTARQNPRFSTPAAQRLLCLLRHFPHAANVGITGLSVVRENVQLIFFESRVHVRPNLNVPAAPISARIKQISDSELHCGVRGIDPPPSSVAHEDAAVGPSPVGGNHMRGQWDSRRGFFYPWQR
jgi:hypothetical protein